MQLSARARMRAVVVLPTPRAPAKTNACASRPLASALRSVLRDGLLADHVVEPLGSPLAGDYLVGHWRNAELPKCRVTTEARAPPRPGWPAAQLRDCLALLPSGPDAVRRLILHRVRAAVRRATAAT